MIAIAPERLAKIEARVNAATRGPWATHLVDSTSVVSSTQKYVCTTCPESEAEREDAYNVEYERMELDAKFIAHARQDISDLLADRRALVAENERFKRDVVRVWVELGGNPTAPITVPSIWDLIAEHKARSEKAEAKAKRMHDLFRQEEEIVSRIWRQLGNPSFEALAGRSIYDLIDEIKACAEKAEADRLTALDQAWEAVNAIGGADMPDDYSRGVNAAVDQALKEIEKLGGMQPERRR